MKSASGPLMGRLAARKRRITPAPTSNRNTRPLTTTAVAGPDAAGSGYGVPVPSRITSVADDALAVEAGLPGWSGRAENPIPSHKRIAKAVCTVATPSLLVNADGLKSA